MRPSHRDRQRKPDGRKRSRSRPAAAVHTAVAVPIGAAEYEAAEVLEGAAVENVLHVTAVEVVNDDDDDEGAVPLHRRGAHPEAWRMNGTLQTWRPIGKTGLTPENSEDEDEEDGLMIVAAAAPRE